MMDASQINELLWCGAAVATEADVEELVAEGVLWDVDCRLEFDDKSLIDEYNNLPPTPDSLKDHPHIDYFYAGVADDGTSKPVSWFQQVWEFAQPLLEAGKPGLSHCAAGVNRGPSMAYFLLRAHWKMSGDDAFALLKEKRPQVNVAYRPDADKAITELGLA